MGIGIGTMLTGATAFAASGTSVKALLQNVNIYVDGTKKTSTNSLTYKGTTYVPVRSVSNSIGKQVGLNGNNLYIGKQPSVKINEEKAISLVIDYFKKTEKVKFKVVYMLDSEDEENYYIGAYEDFPERVLIYKWYKVNKATGKVSIE